MRHKIRQHIGIALMLVIGIGMISHFLGFDATYANTQTSLLDDLQTKLSNYNIWMNVIYIILRPGLIIAGMALDNSMVYGAFFKLDAPLWVIWNIIKNFANFALGFMVLVEIIKIMFSFHDATHQVTSIIKKCIIAGIGIQASWFLLAAVIDLSTVATYGIGGLPLSVLGTSHDTAVQCIADQKVLGVASKIDFTNSQQNGVANQGFIYYYYVDVGGVRKNYSPCVLKDNYVIGRQYGGGQSAISGEIFMEPQYCILGANRVVRFQKEIADNNAGLGFTALQPITDQTSYSINIQNAKTQIGGTGVSRSSLLNAKAVFDIYSGASYTASPYGIVYLYDSNKPGFEDFNGSGVLTMKHLLDSGRGMMGPLITMYASILNFAQFNTQTSTGNDRALVIEGLIKVLFALALFFPTLLTGLVMIVRVGMLWIMIALSPFFVLKRSFDETLGGSINEMHIPVLSYGLGDIIKIIFAPVIVVFAISLCVIFMNLLVSGFSNHGGGNGCAIDTKTMYSNTFNVDQYTYSTGQTLKVGNLFEISNQAFGNSTGGDARDYMGWILINLFGIGVVWLILMAALKATGKLGEASGVKFIEDGAKNLMGSIPFIPVPTSAGMGFVGTKSFTNETTKAMNRLQKNMSLSGSTEEAFSDLMNPSGETTHTDNTATTNTNTVTTLNNDQVTAIETAINSGQSIDQIHNTLNANKDAGLQKSIDDKISETIAKLATKKDQKFVDKKSVQNTIDNFKKIAENNSFTKEQLKNIYTSDSNIKYSLLPKDMEIGTEKVIKINDEYMGITRGDDGNITVNDALKSTDIPSGTTVSVITDDDIRRKNVDDFVKDLEEKKKQHPTSKTKLDEVTSFYPTT